MKIRRVTMVSFIGALGGAFSGAALLAVTTYTAKELDYFGRPMSVWTGAAAIAGALCGFTPGLVLGVAVAASKYQRISAALLGAGIGLIMAATSLVGFFYTPATER